MDISSVNKVDELDTYVFSADPRNVDPKHRNFKGKVWVDQQDFQIVLIDGKIIPDDFRRGHENMSPPFTTYYEQVDGKYWFPTYTKAVDTLQFSSGAKRIRQIIKYENYKKFKADVKLTFGGAVDGGPVDQPPTAPSDRKAPALDPRLNEPKTKKK